MFRLIVRSLVWLYKNLFLFLFSLISHTVDGPPVDGNNENALLCAWQKRTKTKNKTKMMCMHLKLREWEKRERMKKKTQQIRVLSCGCFSFFWLFLWLSSVLFLIFWLCRALHCIALHCAVCALSMDGSMAGWLARYNLSRTQWVHVREQNQQEDVPSKCIDISKIDLCNTSIKLIPSHIPSLFIFSTPIFVHGYWGARVCSIDAIWSWTVVFLLGFELKPKKRQQMTDKYHHWKEKKCLYNRFSLCKLCKSKGEIQAILFSSYLKFCNFRYRLIGLHCRRRHEYAQAWKH